MKAYEFKSVIETRRQVEEEFRFFKEMMERDRNPNHDSHIKNNSTIKAYEFKSVIETRKQIEKEFRFFRKKMEIDRKCNNSRIKKD